MDYRFKNEHISLLYEPILSILEAHPEGLSEYELMKELSKTDHPFINTDGGMGDLELFRSHFFLFHVLYRLRHRLIEEKSYILSIFCLEIRLYPFSETEETKTLAEHDPVRDYYLDLENMTEIGEEEVRGMIDDFFRRLEAYYRVEEDLTLLGLPPEATMEEIRQKYRSLAFELHPDRGGEAGEFRRIEEAMRRLSVAYAAQGGSHHG